MFRLVAMCCAIAAFTFGGLPPAVAAGEMTTYDTVDAVEVSGALITVTGIISGRGSASTTIYFVNGGDVAASRCDRLALLAMSKPGKFQFAMISLFSDEFSCKLIVRTP